MINNSREKDFRGKQEAENDDNKLSKTTSHSRQWGGFKNPRIVRVSRSFGGKDRHSKVCTVRGLRDRRIRLSVPTAIQLYDLQDRVGLSQPSKVVDWLLDATKHEIDKLPPLQMPPGNFSQFHQQTLDPHNSNAPQSSLSPFFNEGTQPLLSSKEGINKINHHVDPSDLTLRGKSRYWDSDTASRAKSKEVESEGTIVENHKWITTNEQENQDGNGGYMAQLSAQNFFPMANQSFSGFPNTAMPYNPYCHWEPSNLSLSQFGSQGFPSQTDPHNSNSVSSLPSSLALPFFYPPATPPPPPSLFPPYPPFMTTAMESDPRQINHFQLLSSSSQHILPNSLVSPLQLISSPLNVHPKVHSQNHEDSQPNKGNSASS